MIYGLIIGIIYLLASFRVDSLNRGRIVVGGRQIHQWMIYLPLFFIFLFISYDVAAFCLVLTIHGISPPSDTTYIEVEQEEELEAEPEPEVIEDNIDKFEVFKPTYNKNMLV